jgi:hypothetical protein
MVLSPFRALTAIGMVLSEPEAAVAAEAVQHFAQRHGVPGRAVERTGGLILNLRKLQHRKHAYFLVASKTTKGSGDKALPAVRRRCQKALG